MFIFVCLLHIFYRSMYSERCEQYCTYCNRTIPIVYISKKPRYISHVKLSNMQYNICNHVYYEVGGVSVHVLLFVSLRAGTCMLFTLSERCISYITVITLPGGINFTCNGYDTYLCQGIIRAYCYNEVIGIITTCFCFLLCFMYMSV